MNCRGDTSKKRTHNIRRREKSGRVDEALEDEEAPGKDLVDTRRSSTSNADRSSALCCAESIKVFIRRKHVMISDYVFFISSRDPSLAVLRVGGSSNYFLGVEGGRCGEFYPRHRFRGTVALGESQPFRLRSNLLGSGSWNVGRTHCNETLEGNFVKRQEFILCSTSTRLMVSLKTGAIIVHCAWPSLIILL